MSTAGEPKERKRHARGMGRTYLRGSIWWIEYSHRGRKHRESSKSEKPADATALLKKRMGEIGRGRLVGPTEERVTFDDLAADFGRDRALKGKRSAKDAAQRVAHLRRHFGFDRAVDITTPRIRAYQDDRLKEGAGAATVNRDLAALSRMFTLAIQAGRLSTKPHIPRLPEPQARQGFFEHGHYLAVRAKLPDDHADILDFGYLTGWRVSEILTLEWADVVDGVIRLRPELSKNRRGRVIALAGPLADVLERRQAARKLTTPRVFHYHGRRITNLRKRWRTACTAAGLPGMKFHDLRRTAVRNLTRAGVPDSVAMNVTGHKTRSVFDRYNIVSEDDTRQAAVRMGAYVETLSTDATPTVASVSRKSKTGGRG